MLFAILLPALLGMVGLVIDGGLLMASYRQVQNAADSAALAAAMDKYRGAHRCRCAGHGEFLHGQQRDDRSHPRPQRGGLERPQHPPAGSRETPAAPTRASRTMSRPSSPRQVNTLFMPVLGINSSQVTARAVAGFEPVGAGEGAIVLDPTASPGIAVSGNNTLLVVNGTVVVNSQGGGLDQYGNVQSPGSRTRSRPSRLPRSSPRTCRSSAGSTSSTTSEPTIRRSIPPTTRATPTGRSSRELRSRRSPRGPGDADDEQRRSERVSRQGRGQSVKRPEHFSRQW